MRPSRLSLYLGFFLFFTLRAEANLFEHCKFILERVEEVSEIKNFKSVPAWTVAHRDEMPLIKEKVAEQFAKDPDGIELKMVRELGLNSKYDLRDILNLKKIWKTVRNAVSKTIWNDGFAPPGAVKILERRQVDEELLSFPTADYLKFNAKDAETTEAKNALNIHNVARSVTSGNLVKESDMEALKSLAEQAENLLVRAKNLNRDSTSIARLDGRIAEYLEKNLSEFENNLAEMKADESLFIVLPRYQKGTDKLELETLRISSLASLKQVLKRFKEAKKEIGDLDERMTQYTYDYIYLREAADRVDSVSSNELSFHATGTPDADEIARKSLFEEIQKKLEDVFSNESPVHPSATNIKHTTAIAKNLIRGKSAYSLFLKTVGYGSLLLAVTAQTGFFNDHLVQPTLIWWEKKYPITDEEWIKKCSEEDTFENIQACLRRYSVILDGILKEKQEKATKAGDSKTIVDFDKDFYSRYSKVSRETYLLARRVIRNTVSRQLIDNWALQEAYNIIKVEDAKAKESSDNQGKIDNDLKESQQNGNVKMAAEDKAALDKIRIDAYLLVENFQQKMKELNKDETNSKTDEKIKLIEDELKNLATIEFGLEIFKEKKKSHLDTRRVDAVAKYIVEQAEEASKLMSKLLEENEKANKSTPVPAKGEEKNPSINNGTIKIPTPPPSPSSVPVSAPKY